MWLKWCDCLLASKREPFKGASRHDTTHPISSIYGGTGNLNQAVEALPIIDIWGFNIYSGISAWPNKGLFGVSRGFGNLFSDVASITGKPMYLGRSALHHVHKCMYSIC